MFVIFLKTKTGFDELVSSLRQKCGDDFIVVKPELCFSEKFLRYTLFLAYKSFQNGTASAKTLGLEWLCRMAGTGNVSTAISLCLPSREKGTVVGIACPRKIEGAELADLGKPVEIGLAALGKKAAALFKVSKNELANNSLEDLLIERAALAAVA